ncbi:MAG: DUF1801 domain-containing protein [Anaerosomatales bacterium]|nr:DUF1801 domain-containing protein [Anaerosomatales bacterium]
MAVDPIDEYISGYPLQTQAVLRRLRAIIREEAPEAAETISYRLPTFDLNGKHLVHFGGFTEHVGLYPTPSGTDAFSAEIARYKHGKGSVQFPLDEPLPEDLIRRIVRFRVGEVTGG